MAKAVIVIEDDPTPEHPTRCAVLVEYDPQPDPNSPAHSCAAGLSGMLRAALGVGADDAQEGITNGRLN
jgi:hypothetical protein